MAMLSPQSFANQFESHFWPSSIASIPIKEKAYGSTENLFAKKEEQINNLMKVNIIFKKNIQLFYEFYCIQSYLTQQMIDILKQLCFENEMNNDIPSDHELVQGFNETFVVPIYHQLVTDMYSKPQLPNDEEIKQKLQIQKYPMYIKRQIESIAYNMGLLLVIACDELQLDNDEKVLDYIEEYKSVCHHTLTLKLLGYKRLLNGLALRYCCYHAIIGYIHEYGSIDNDEMVQEIKELILMSFYCPFGYDKTCEEIKTLIYEPFQHVCGDRIAVLLESIINSVMGVHMFLTHHSQITNDAMIDETITEFDEPLVVVEDIWD